MIIAFLITGLDYSGGPKMQAWVANQLAKEGHEVHFVSIYSKQMDQPVDSRIKVNFVESVQHKSRFYRNTIGAITDVLKLDAIIKQINPDIILSFIHSIDIFYLLYSRLMNKKRIFIISLRMDPYSQRGIIDRIRLQLTTLADGYVFQSDGAKNYFSTKSIKKAIIIPNPVTKKTLKFCENIMPFLLRDNIVVVPARLDIPQKRQDVALKAFSIVVQKYPQMKLVFLGNGPDKNELIKFAKQLKIEKWVEFHKTVPSAEEYIRNCKIVLFTSDHEGIPNALIEAAALGINIVTTDFKPGSARMILEDNKSGYIVARGDYCSLAEKIIFLLEHPILADQYSKVLRDIKTKYSEEVIGKKWNDFVNEVYNVAKVAK